MVPGANQQNSKLEDAPCVIQKKTERAFLGANAASEFNFEK
jgi:hypothetical protein